MSHKNVDRTYILGVWWVKFTNSACNTITAYRDGLDSWNVHENWTESDGQLFHREIYRVEDATEQEVISIIDSIVCSYEPKRRVKSFTILIKDDSEDVYDKIHNIFVNLGVTDS